MSQGGLLVERPVAIEDGDFNKQTALVYHFGHTSPNGNIKLYNTIVTALAEMCEKKYKEHLICKQDTTILVTNFYQICR